MPLFYLIIGICIGIAAYHVFLKCQPEQPEPHSQKIVDTPQCPWCQRFLRVCQAMLEYDIESPPTDWLDGAPEEEQQWWAASIRARGDARKVIAEYTEDFPCTADQGEK